MTASTLPRLLVALAALVLAACGDGASPVDSGAPSSDAGTPEDGHVPPGDAGPHDAGDDGGPAPDAGLGEDAGGTPDAGSGCGAGLHDCDGACVPDVQACGVPLPTTACSGSAECGAAGECIDAACVCAEGYLPCTAGCCPVTYATTTLAGGAGRGVQLQHGPDGTAYVLVHAEVGPPADTRYELHLYTRAPGSSTIERAALTIPVSYESEAFDFEIRDDGALLAAVARASGESTHVDLHEWRPGMTASTSELIGSGFGYDIGVGLAIDGAGTVWASWSRSRSGGLSAFSRTRDGLRRSYEHSTGGTVEESDVEWSRVGDEVHSFWAHRYTGAFTSGAVLLAGTTALASRCPADDAAFDSTGRQWSIYASYSSIRTYFCVGGTSVRADMTTVRGAVPTAFLGPIAIDGEDTAFVAFYEPATYTAHWLASRDGQRWARGVLPVTYGLPSGTTSPGTASVASSRSPSGRVSFVVLPSDATMGPMTLIDFE